MRGDTSTAAILHDLDMSGHVGALWAELFRKTRGEDAMPEESGGASEPKPTVLCVDDEPSIREVLEAELENEAYEAVIVASGPEGLDWLETREAAVVLSDHLMPDMSGTEFLARARERWPDSFRIMLTAHGDLETVISAVNIGEIHRFLSKPWDPRGLKLAINEGLERHRLIQENRELVRRLDAQNIELRSLNETLEARVAERTAQLEQAHAELVQTEKLSAVGRLAAGVVHEVLNPLSVAAGRVEMVLLDPNLSEEHGGSLKIGREQIDQAIQILDNLRDFSRRRPSKRSAVDLSPLVLHTMQLIAHETTRRSIEVVERLPDTPEVQADQDQLAQVFLNLANNAVDAMASGGRLTVETHAVAEGGYRMVDAVFEDTGPGISEEDLARIFDPFFTTKEDGTGLGLSICQSIVKGHGGEIRVTSDVGKGTRFVVRLPEEAQEGTNEE